MAESFLVNLHQDIPRRFVLHILKPTGEFLKPLFSSEVKPEILGALVLLILVSGFFGVLQASLGSTASSTSPSKKKPSPSKSKSQSKKEPSLSVPLLSSTSNASDQSDAGSTEKDAETKADTPTSVTSKVVAARASKSVGEESSSELPESKPTAHRPSTRRSVAQSLTSSASDQIVTRRASLRARKGSADKPSSTNESSAAAAAASVVTRASSADKIKRRTSSRKTAKA